MRRTIVSLAAASTLAGQAASWGQSPTTAPAPVQAVPTERLAPTTAPTGVAGAVRADDLTDLSLEELMNVEVASVSKKTQTILQAPAAVTVITQDDIRRSGFGTIPDMLRLVPGATAARVNGYTWAVGVRGLTDQFTNSLLVLQDGRSVYTPFFGGVYWNTIDYVLDDLDRIEVIRGPGATLWGSNAVNGVINITSKDSRDTQGWLLSTRGSNEDSNLSLRYGGRYSPDTTYRVYVKEKYDRGTVDAAGDDAQDDWNAVQAGFRIDKHPDDDTTLTLQGDLHNDRTNEPTVASIATPPFVQEQTLHNSYTSGNVLGRVTHRSADDASYQLQVYYSYLDTPGYNENTVDVDFNSRFKIGERNEVVWGLGYRAIASYIKPDDMLAADSPQSVDNVFSAFAQDTVALQPDHWFFTFGTKLERNDHSGLEVEPSARLLWTPNKQNSFWAAVSRAVRTPTRVETDALTTSGTSTTVTGGTTVPVTGVLVGNEDLKANELTSYELGYRVEVDKRFSVDVASFYNAYENLTSLNAGTPTMGAGGVTLPLVWANNISGHTYGGEVSSTVQMAPNWRLTGSYALLFSAFNEGGATPSGQLVGVYEDSSPQQQAQLRSYWDITRKLQLNAAVFYVGSIEEYDIPSYVSTSVNVQWKPAENADLTVGVLNVFDNHHPEFAGSFGRGVGGEVPLTAFVQFSYRF